MRTSFVAVALLSLLVSGCALRPRYAQVLPANLEEGDVAWLQLVDGTTGSPLPDVPVIVGEGRERVRQRTNAEGIFTLPVQASWQRSNPIIEVTLPRGVTRYEIRPAQTPAEQPSPEQTPPAARVEETEAVPEPAPEADEAPAAEPETETEPAPEAEPGTGTGTGPETPPEPEATKVAP